MGRGIHSRRRNKKDLRRKGKAAGMKKKYIKDSRGHSELSGGS
jgi:hypothetical protein